MEQSRISKSYSTTIFALLLGMTVFAPWTPSIADDDVLTNPNAGATPLVFSGASVEGAAPDDDTLRPTPVATLSFGGRHTDAAAAYGAAAPQQAPAQADPAGIPPGVQEALKRILSQR